jgi:hypothetical protein
MVGLPGGIAELDTYRGVGEGEYHQKKAQDDPGDNGGDKGYFCQLSAVFLRPGLRGTHGRQAMDAFMSDHSDKESQPDSTGNTSARVRQRTRWNQVSLSEAKMNTHVNRCGRHERKWWEGSARKIRALKEISPDTLLRCLFILDADL